MTGIWSQANCAGNIILEGLRHKCKQNLTPDDDNLEIDPSSSCVAWAMTWELGYICVYTGTMPRWAEPKGSNKCTADTFSSSFIRSWLAHRQLESSINQTDWLGSSYRCSLQEPWLVTVCYCTLILNCDRLCTVLRHIVSPFLMQRGNTS